MDYSKQEPVWIRNNIFLSLICWVKEVQLGNLEPVQWFLNSSGAQIPSSFMTDHHGPSQLTITDHHNWPPWTIMTNHRGTIMTDHHQLSRLTTMDHHDWPPWTTTTDHHKPIFVILIEMLGISWWKAHSSSTLHAGAKAMFLLLSKWGFLSLSTKPFLDPAIRKLGKW